MLWFHRLQQRLSLTRNESVTLIVLSTLFAAGLVARHIQQQSIPVAPDAYAESDSAFFARAAEIPNDGSEGPVASVGASEAVSTEAADTSDGPGAAARGDANERAHPYGLIDLNSASFEALQRLPRVGPATAERIIEFREAYGPFRRIDDLIQVRGIGPKTLEQIKPMATVSSVGE